MASFFDDDNNDKTDTTADFFADFTSNNTEEESNNNKKTKKSKKKKKKKSNNDDGFSSSDTSSSSSSSSSDSDDDDDAILAQFMNKALKAPNDEVSKRRGANKPVKNSPTQKTLTKKNNAALSSPVVMTAFGVVQYMPPSATKQASNNKLCSFNGLDVLIIDGNIDPCNISNFLLIVFLFSLCLCI